MTGLALRSWCRRSVWALLLVVVVGGVTAGVAAGLVHGAGRTRTATDRFVDQARVPEVFVESPGVDPRDVAAIRGVAGVQGVTAISMGGVGIAGSDLYLQVGRALDAGYGRDVNAGRIVQGRAVRNGADDEVVLPEPIAKALDATVGARLRLTSYTPAQIMAMQRGENVARPAGPRPAVTVVGIQRMPANVVTDKILSDQVILPVGFSRRYGDRIGAWGHGILVDLDASPSREQVEAVVRRIEALPGFADRRVSGGAETIARPIQPTLDFVATGLLLLAAAIGITGLLAVVLIVSRLLDNLAEESSLIGVLGASPPARRRVLTLVLTPAAVGAAVTAAAVSVLTSAFVPFGIAGRADPEAGLRVDFPTLVAAAVVAGLAVMLVALAAAWRVGRGRRVHRAGRRTRLNVGSSPVREVGLAFAFERGDSGRRGSGRVAVIGLAVAGAALVATFIFVASTAHLLDTPAAYGWTWDVQVNAKTLERVEAQPGVAGASEILVATVPHDGNPVTVRGVRLLSGPPPLRLLRGRFVTGPDDVVLGAHSMADKDLDIGDRVVLGDGGRRHTFRVVGEAVFAGVEDVPFAATGAVVRLDALADLVRGSDDEGFATGVVTLEPGVDRTRFLQRLTALRNADPERVKPTPGVDIERLREADALPWVLVAFLASVGILSLTAAVMSVVRGRRRELAVLRTIGFTGTDVRRSVVVQVVALTVAGLLIGVPVGLVLGRSVWRWFAADLGVAPDLITPWLPIGALVIATVVGFALASFVPAWAAARIRPAEALRTE